MIGDFMFPLGRQSAAASRLVVRDEMPMPDADGYVTVEAQAIREVHHGF